MAAFEVTPEVNLLISILTRFREVLTKEIALIEKAKAK
jgi:hypothetical protein